MIGLREDQQVRTQLVGKINALFPVLSEAFVASGLARVGPRSGPKTVHHRST